MLNLIILESFDLEDEFKRFDDQFNHSSNGWAELEENAAILSRIISQLFAQLLQMFARSKRLFKFFAFLSFL